jgi:hypothetical protein
MSFKTGDRVLIRMTAKDQRDETLNRLDGESATVSMIYQNSYEPDVDRYEVQLDNPSMIAGRRTSTVPGLYSDNLVKISGSKSKKIEESQVLKFNDFSLMNEAKGAKRASWYWGIASCNGVDSFIQEDITETERQMVNDLEHLGLADEEDLQSIKAKVQAHNAEMHGATMACHANPQRFMVVYRAKITDDDAELIHDSMRSGENEFALRVLKANSIEIQLAGGSGSRRTWERIPNKSLDPYGSY